MTSAQDLLRGRPRAGVANVAVEAGEDSVTGLAGAVLWGPLLDRLNVVGAADGRDLRPASRRQRATVQALSGA